MSSVAIWGQRPWTSSAVSTSIGMSSASKVGTVASTKPRSSPVNHSAPASRNRTWPVSASSVRQPPSDSRAQCVYKASAPCPQRLIRVWSPDVARA